MGLRHMRIADADEVRCDQVDCEFPVRCRDVDQFAADETLRTTVFMDCEMCALGAENRMEGIGDATKPQDVCRSAVVDEVRLSVRSEHLFESSRRAPRVVIESVRDRISCVHFFEGVEDFWMNTRVIVASKPSKDSHGCIKRQSF